MPMGWKTKNRGKLIESLQWVARFAQAGVAVLKVKEAVLHAAPVSFGAASITF